MTTAPEILQAGIGHMQDRAATYDKPEGERSMAATVAAFNAVTGDGRMDTEERGWLFLLLLKAVRSQQGAFKLDNYEDGAAYFGLMGEAASKERKRHATSISAVAPAYPAVEVGVDVRFDQTGRQEAVEQNGNDGALYREPGYAGGQIPSSQDREPERPRHLCQTCAQGHATHECTAGQEAIPLGELAIQAGSKPVDEEGWMSREEACAIHTGKLYDVKYKDGFVAAACTADYVRTLNWVKIREARA